MNTSLDPGPGRLRWSARRILPFLLSILAVLALAAAADAQAKRPRAERRAARASAKASEQPKGPEPQKTSDLPMAGGDEAPPATSPAKDKGEKAAASARPQEKGKAEKGKADKGKAKELAATWKRVSSALYEGYFARHPDQAFERAPAGIEPRLGTFGTGASLAWRRTLTTALADLPRLRAARAPRESAMQLGALADWTDAELLLLDGRTPSSSDPAGYVQRAERTLRAALEAQRFSPEERQARLRGLLGELPEYFRDARLGLLAAGRPWIDLALLDLDDLLELVDEVGEQCELDAGPQPDGAVAEDRSAARAPRAAVEDFRRWLLSVRPDAITRPPCLNGNAWLKLVSLASGRSWTSNEIKVLCLREVARLDSTARGGKRRRAADSDDLVHHAWSASTRALRVGQEAHLLHQKLSPQDVAFAVETSLRTQPEVAWLRPGKGLSSRVYLSEPHGSWSIERTVTRSRRLQTVQQVALGVRHGMTGEGLFALRSRTAKNAPAMLLENRMLRAGFGLFALDWVGRVDWAENPFLADEELALETAFQRGYEAARLLAALEMHVEGLSLEEAARNLRRRTGVDADTAQIESLTALRDPLHGIGYLGLTELCDLEGRLAALTGRRQGLRFCILLVSRHPELRPADLAAELGRGPRRENKGLAATELEKTGQPQQEHPRSR